MWIMTNTGWMSIVKHRTKKDVLILRARNVDPLLKYFPPREIIYNLHADYAWRVETTLDYCLKIVATEIYKIDYGNFKESVEDGSLCRAYHQVWSIGLSYQLDEEETGLSKLTRKKRFVQTSWKKSKRNKRDKRKTKR